MPKTHAPSSPEAVHAAALQQSEFFELGDIDLPDQGMFGLNFISLYERDVYTLNTETTTWDLVGTAADNDQLGHYMLQRQDPVDVYGTLYTEMTFSDR